MYAHLAEASVRHLCGVQIVDEGGMDVMSWSVWRPELGCEAEWTPLTGWRGVQIVDVGWNGRHVLVRTTSRLWMWGGMDASVVMRRRPDLGCEAEWTPCAGAGGVQINV